MFEADGFSTIKGLTNAAVQRQEILSTNLTNIETKGYIRQEIDFAKVLGELKDRVPSFDEDSEGMLARARYKDYSKPMTLESELSKLYDNHLKYLLLIKSINHHFEHMKKALEVRAM